MNPAIIVIIAFPFFFIALWLGVTFILAKMGWAKIEQFYQHDQVVINGEDLGTAGGRINGVNYNGVLELTSNQHGLYVKPIKIFSAFHTPIMIPWEEIYKGSSTNLMVTKYTSIIVMRDKKKLASFRLNEQQITAIKRYLK